MLQMLNALLSPPFEGGVAGALRQIDYTSKYRTGWLRPKQKVLINHFGVETTFVFIS